MKTKPTDKLAKLKPVRANSKLGTKHKGVPYVPFRSNDPYVACPICGLGYTYLGIMRHVMACQI